MTYLALLIALNANARKTERERENRRDQRDVERGVAGLAESGREFPIEREKRSAQVFRAV